VDRFDHPLLLASLVLLVLTKLADLWTTLRHVGRDGESNPLARAFFRRAGFGGGLALVIMLWTVIVVIVYATAWNSPGWIRWATTLSGLFISWVQWDVARFNATRRPSRITRWAAIGYHRWTLWLAARQRRKG
jgi:cytochrome c biogenesis protein CcdA